MPDERSMVKILEKLPYAAVAAEPDDVPSAPVVNVICECTNRMEHLFGVPVLLVFDPRAFNLALVNQVVYVQRQ